MEFNKLAVVYEWAQAVPVGPGQTVGQQEPKTPFLLPSYVDATIQLDKSPVHSQKRCKYVQLSSAIFYLYTVPQCYHCWKLRDTSHNGTKSFCSDTE